LRRADKDQPPPRTFSPADSTHRHAIGSPVAIAVFVVLTGAALASDLFSKHYVFSSLLEDPSTRQRAGQSRDVYSRPLDGEDILQELRIQRRLFPGVRITLSTNPGIAFGLRIPTWTVNVATVMILAVVLFLFTTSSAKDRIMHISLALILAGAMGNFYDRLFSVVALPGAAPIRNQVRDFIDCRELHYPYIFNAADIFLVVGPALLILQWLLAALKRAKTAGRKRGH